MRSKTRQPSVVVKNSQESLSTWTSRPYISNTLREQLSKANVLLVPTEGYGDQPGLVFFPSGTEEVFQFLRESQQGNLSVDICIEDKDYKEVARHAEILIIASLIVTTIVAPVVADLIAEYIKRRWGSREVETTVKLEITVCDEKAGRSVRISYEGPASEYRNTMGNAIQNLNNPHDPSTTQLTKNDPQNLSSPTKSAKIEKVHAKKWKKRRK